MASRPRGRLISQMASSLIMKKDVAWALSGLLAAREATLRNGLPSSLFFPWSVGPSCMTPPVTPTGPVAAMRIASSSGVRGAGTLVLWWLMSPAVIDTPWATRRVRRSCIPAIKRIGEEVLEAGVLQGIVCGCRSAGGVDRLIGFHGHPPRGLERMTA